MTKTLNIMKPKDRFKIIRWANSGKNANDIVPKLKRTYTRQQIAGVIAWIKIRNNK